MSGTYVALTKLPETIQSALSSVGYCRQDIEVTASETYSPLSAGSKGKQSFCVCLDIKSGDRESRIGSWGGPNIGNHSNQVDNDSNNYPIPPNGAVITGSTGYKGTFASITVAPDMLQKFLPITDDSITDADKAWLYILKTNRPSYRKSEANRASIPWPTTDRLEHLKGKGLIKINKAGSIQLTTDGKNAAKKSGYSIY